MRSTAEKLIKEFISRAIEVKNNPYYLFKVKRAIVFGSYLSNEERISDIDIAIEIISKEVDTKKHKILVDKKIREVHNKGRQFRSDLEAIFWPQIEVEQYLRAKSSSISLEYVENDEI